MQKKNYQTNQSDYKEQLELTVIKRKEFWVGGEGERRMKGEDVRILACKPDKIKGKGQDKMRN
jgi:hypothetical protein